VPNVARPSLSADFSVFSRICRSEYGVLRAT
jgi:hypothetical protein